MVAINTTYEAGDLAVRYNGMGGQCQITLPRGGEKIPVVMYRFERVDNRIRDLNLDIIVVELRAEDRLSDEGLVRMAADRALERYAFDRNGLGGEGVQEEDFVGPREPENVILRTGSGISLS